MAKCFRAIYKTTPRAAFPGILLVNGRTSADDEYVEVHIWGPISVYSLEKIVVHKANPLRSMKEMEKLRELLRDTYNIELET